MHYYYIDHQLAHVPTQYMVHGRIVRPLENAERVAVLRAALQACGIGHAAAESDPADLTRAILAVHADHFVDFLRTAYDDFMALPNHGPEALPNVMSYRGSGPDFGPRGPARPTGIIGRAGWYMGDLSAVITEGTFRAAGASAASAIAAADAVVSGAAAAHALCRPPGHHAYVDRCAGFCFLNNAAIAAERLRRHFGRVAILDFDTHHGDGTQAIFYRRADVLVASVHTDPSAYYPHFSGYADERGHGSGEGANLNLPLPFGADDAAFIEANRAAIAAAVGHGAEAVVISAGWDAHRLDPLSRLAVTTDAYARIGELYGRLGLPTVIVQEGGYSLEAIGEASQAFLSAFRSDRGV
ncbi:histone deacetylase family protein [Alsobacter sp. R-9]